VQKAVETFRLDARGLKDILIYGFKRSFFPGGYPEKRDWVRSVLNHLEDQIAAAGHDVHSRRR
jgi:adenosine deaminase